MNSSIARLREALGELLQYYPLVIRNVFDEASSPSPPPQSSAQTSTHDARYMADTVEGFLAELTRVLSIGLHDGDGFEIWSVLELLECVPDRMQAEAEAIERFSRSAVTPPQKGSSPQHAHTARPAASASVEKGSRAATAALPATSPSPHRSAYAVQSSTETSTAARVIEKDEREPWRHHLQRFHFASQLVYVVRTSFPAAPRPLQARILLRLALGQGCLLAAIEMLRRWCRTELEGFYGPAQTTGALLIQPDSDSDVWNSFVAAIAPVAGPPIAEIAAGAPKISSQPFHLQPIMRGLDDDPFASLMYYTQLEGYVQGRRATRPSALACHIAALQRRAQKAEAKATLPRPVPSSADLLQASSEARGGRRSARVPALQRVLHIESLPLPTAAPAAASHRRKKKTMQDGSREEGENEGSWEGGSQSSHSTQPHAQHSSDGQQRRRGHRQKRRRRKQRSHPNTSSNGGHDEDDSEDEDQSQRSGDDSVANNVKGEGEESEGDGEENVGENAVPSRASSRSSLRDAPPSVPSAQRRSRRSSTASFATQENPTTTVSRHSTHEGISDLADEPLQQPHGASPSLRLCSGSGEVVEASAVHVPIANATATAAISFSEEPTMDGPATGGSPPQTTYTASRHLHDCHNEVSGPECTAATTAASADVVSVVAVEDAADLSASLPEEMRELHRRVLQCWAVAVAHAEAQERKRLGARDADANAMEAII